MDSHDDSCECVGMKNDGLFVPQLQMCLDNNAVTFRSSYFGYGRGHF